MKSSQDSNRPIRSHATNVALAIDRCRELALKWLSKETVRHFNKIMDQITHTPKGVKTALCN